jgi:hypothetical protein
MRRPLAAAAAVAAVLGLLLLLVRPDDPPLGAVIGLDDRRALAAVPVRRGTDPQPLDPAVDRTDPRVVARAYLVAAHSATADDGGRTQRRAAGYAVPGSPPAVVGGIVLDPPPPGTVRVATVTALALLAADPADRRRGYRAELGVATGPPGGAQDVQLLVRDVVLARGPDGAWSVAADTTAGVDLADGEG